MQNGTATVENRIAVPQKMFLKKLPNEPSNFICGYTQSTENSTLERYLHTHANTALFITAKMLKQLKCLSVDE
jgi:hypothetical protein